MSASASCTTSTASELTLRYYCVHAYGTLSHATIQVYLAGIRHGHLQLSYRDPLANVLPGAILCFCLFTRKQHCLQTP